MANEIVTFESISNELSVRPDGVAKCTIRGAARICDVEDSSLIRAFQSAAQKPSKLAEILIGAGFDGAAQNKFSEDGIPDQALAIIIGYPISACCHYTIYPGYDRSPRQNASSRSAENDCVSILPIQTFHAT